MELWATGFNAWDQLRFVGDSEAQPRDLHQFESVLQDGRIEVLRSSLSATLVGRSSKLHSAGSTDQLIKLCSDRDDALSNLAVAGNDKVAEFRANNISQYHSFDAYLNNSGHTFGLPEEIIQLTANQTTFTALSSTGQVYTWGDGRYEACLGREVTSANPASVPAGIEELSELPDRITKISSGGYATAALTAGNDIYLWGREGHPEMSEPLSAAPTPVDLEGSDFLDVSVGMNHVIVLTTERKVFVVGAGGNGQLGMKEMELRDWKEACLPLREGQRIVSVHAGYKNSFVVVEDST